MLSIQFSKYSGVFLTISILLLGCSQENTASTSGASTDQTAQSLKVRSKQVLPALQFKPLPATQTIKSCQQDRCAGIEIVSLTSNDAWLNQWISQQIALIVAAQADDASSEKATRQKQVSLNSAVSDYIQASEEWQRPLSSRQAYRLQIEAQIPSQHQNFVLLQLSLTAKQQETQIQDRQYFFVADRITQKTLKIVDVVDPEQAQHLQVWLQKKYQLWLKAQSAKAQVQAPKQLDWRQADWFFDQQGIGLHYRAGQIDDYLGQFDAYFSPKQSKTLLLPEIYHKMF